MDAEMKEKIIKSFEALLTGNVSDAMDALHLKRGVICGVHPIGRRCCTAGVAHTILQAPRKTAYDGNNLAKQGNIIDTDLQTYEIIVIDAGGVARVSTGGGILALRAQMKGARGEVTNGYLRDIDEISKLGFPVWCAGSSPIKSAFDIETVGNNVPIVMNGVDIIPGDLLVMDSTGVVVVPKDHIEEVLEKAQSIFDREEKMIALIKNGGTLADARKIK